MTSSEAEQLGRYQLLRPLGRGGMGVVYLASSRGAAGFEKLVALKVLHPQFGDNPKRARRLIREAFVGVRLDHQNVVQVLDLGEEDGRYFICMEYVRGFTLAHLIAHCAAENAQLPIPVVAHIVRLVCGALDYFHGLKNTNGEPLGLVHRDVTPSNILLATDGRVKLSDFGVAALTIDGNATRQVMGKLPFLPPEAMRGGAATQAWDLYALGAVMYEALAAEPAFRGDTPRDVLESIAKGAPPLARMRKHCPPDLAELIAKSMHRDAQRRFATAAEFRLALDEVVTRSVDTPDEHRDFVQASYSADSFVEEHGSLPRTGGFGSTIEVAPAKDLPTGFTTSATIDAKPVVPLRLGMSPALGTRLARAAGLRVAQCLQASLGREVRTMVYGDYETLVDCLVHGEVDLAWMPPALYVDAAARGAGPVAIARRGGGTSYQAAIVVAQDSPVKELGELRGKTMGWVDRNSASGYIFGFAEIARQVGDPDDIFERQQFLGSHQAVCEAVADGSVTAGSTYVVCSEDGNVVAAAWDEPTGGACILVRPIAFSKPIPGDNIAHRPMLPSSVRHDVQQALMRLGDSESGRELLRDVFRSDGFLPADDKNYDSIREALKLVRRAG